ncbi:MAG: CinA family protein, partial [Pseudomonadota bacterium]
MFDEELQALAAMVVRDFAAAGKKLATVESCTGGMIGACITSAPGSSAVFDRGFLTYSNEAKQDLVSVDPETLTEHGAVSAQCASQMAIGGLKAAGVDAVVAVTGIAGPGGGSKTKPVGLVFIAVASTQEEGAFVEQLEFGDIGREN